MVATRPALREQHLELLVDQPDFEAEFATPHFLQHLGEQAVIFRGVVQQFEDREATAVGETSLGEQGARCGQITGGPGRWGVTRQTRRGDRRSRQLPPLQQILHDAVAIDCERQRTADPLVVQGRLAGVDPEEIGVEVRIGAEEMRSRPAVGVDLAEGQHIGDMELAGAKRALFGLDAFRRVEVNRVQPHARRVPIGRRFLHHDHPVGLPSLECKGPVANQPARTRPGVAPGKGGTVGRDRGQRYRQPRRMGQQGQKMGSGMFERDPKRPDVGRAGPDLAEIRVRVLVEGLRTLHDI